MLSSFFLFLDSVTTGPVRNYFAEFGLYYPWQRAIVIAVAWLAFLFLYRPKRSFDEGGNPKPWLLMSGGAKPQDTTAIPWWLEVYTVGLAADLFI